MEHTTVNRRDVGSIPIVSAVAVAEMAMHRIVVPEGYSLMGVQIPSVTLSRYNTIGSVSDL